MCVFPPYLPFVAAMALVVVASNILVQFPVQGQVGSLALADILTWGAFTYPFAFLVTDLANRRYGPAVARRIVFVGFMLAVALLDRRAAAALPLRPDRIRDGSRPAGAHRGRLGRGIPDRATARRDRVQLAAPAVAGGARRSSARWPARWSTPRSSSRRLFGGFRLRRPERRVLRWKPRRCSACLPAEAARWVSWALGDLGVKLIIAVFALIPYRLIAARWSQPALAA